MVTSSVTAMHLPNNRPETESTQKAPKDLMLTLGKLQIWRQGFLNSTTNNKNAFYKPLEFTPAEIRVLFVTEWAYPNQGLLPENQR